MDAVKAIRDYVATVLSSTLGLKALLLDEETSRTVSMAHAWSMKELYQMEVFSVCRLDDQVSARARPPLPDVTAVVLLRPTRRSVSALCAELREPRHRRYHVFFTNILDPDRLKELALADVHNVVRAVEEVYADFGAVDPHLFTLYTPSCAMPSTGNGDGGGVDATQWQPAALHRATAGLTSVLRALRREHAVVRYQASSSMCALLAERVAYSVGVGSGDSGAEGGGGGGKGGDEYASKQPPLLLIVDRRDDAVTPCLQQWTYQAM
eukprot:UC1_evm1s769